MSSSYYSRSGHTSAGEIPNKSKREKSPCFIFSMPHIAHLINILTIFKYFHLHLQRHAYVDSLEINCRTPLMLSAACNLPDMCAILLDAGTTSIFIYFLIILEGFWFHKNLIIINLISLSSIGIKFSGGKVY